MSGRCLLKICKDKRHELQTELNKVCEELNQKNAEVPVPLFEVIDIAHHPTVLFHFGAYTFIGYNGNSAKIWVQKGCIVQKWVQNGCNFEM